MAVNDAEKNLEEQIRVVGVKLQSPPALASELLPLLDQMESFLTNVDQSPSPSMLATLRPTMDALVTKELLDHDNVDVRVAVASCLSEVTRITAPDAPFSDETMKNIFKRIVESFENIDDLSSRSFLKRVSVLETVAKVRSCVVMLDLECDDLILEMFRHFIKFISIKHEEAIFSSMETIMSLVIEESEDISPDLVSCLLHSVKKERKADLPVSFRLGEKVIRNCADKLKPIIINLVQDNLNTYSKFIASLCQDGSEAVEQQSDVEASHKNAAEESKMSERTVSEEGAQGSAKEDIEEQVGCTEEVLSAAPNGSSTSSPPVDTGNGGSNVEEPPSPKQKSERVSVNIKKPTKAESSSQKEVVTPAVKSDERVDQPAKAAISFTSQEVLSDKKAEEQEVEEIEVQVADNGEETPLPESGSGSRPKRSRPVPTPVKKDVVEGASDSEGKSLRQSKRKIPGGDVKKSTGGKKQRKDDVGNTNDDVIMKGMVTPKPAEKMPEAGGSKRKRVPEKVVKVSDVPVKKPKNFDDSIVGAKIKVWWPDDHAYYEGVIDQYDPSDNRHTIIYDDGDVEVLSLKDEKWEIVEDEKEGKKAKTSSSVKKGGSKSKTTPIETPKTSKMKEIATRSSQKPKPNGTSSKKKGLRS